MKTMVLADMQFKSVLPAFFLALLAACGGGGGGGSSGPTDVQFTSFSGLGPNQRANMTGISQTAYSISHGRTARYS